MSLFWKSSFDLEHTETQSCFLKIYTHWELFCQKRYFEEEKKSLFFWMEAEIKIKKINLNQLNVEYSKVTAQILYQAKTL